MHWQPSPSTLLLDKHTIHIWRANLDTVVCPLSAILSADEKARAEKFIFELHRNRFTAARTLLRYILSRYLDRSPTCFIFQYTEYGKPYLPNVDICFNVSHSNQWALYAIGLEEKIGIDIEHMCADREIEKIAARFFSTYENQLLHETEIDKKLEMFYRIWTCKEAFIKATGEGLSFPLKDFDVQIGEGSARLVSVKQNQAEAQRWACTTFDPTENYVATLAVGSPIRELKFWNL